MCGNGNRKMGDFKEKGDNRNMGILQYIVDCCRVSDPYSFFPDPDPDPDPEVEVGDKYGSGSNTDPDPIRIQGFNDQKLQKNDS